jgi:hypothetical protein
MSLTLADLAAGNLESDFTERPTWDELLELRRYLQLGLADMTAERDLHDPPLRITKGRLRTTAICPAQLLAELSPFSIDFNLAVGIVCDAAAGVLAVHPSFPCDQGWYQALTESLSQEHPHVVEFVSGLGPADRLDIEDRVDELCGSLPILLGDLRPHRPTVHHRIAYVPVPAVHLTGEVDIAVDLETGSGRILAEVKSGPFNPRISDELAHYGLITHLQRLPSAADHEADLDGHPPTIAACSVSLGDLAVTPVSLPIEVLETAARRILDTSQSLVSIDQLMTAGQSPPTNPGAHCRWCRRVRACGDAPDLVLAELDSGGDRRAPMSPETRMSSEASSGEETYDGDQFESADGIRAPEFSDG